MITLFVFMFVCFAFGCLVLIACVEELLGFVRCSFLLIVLIRCEVGCFFLLFIVGVLFVCLMIDLFVLVGCLFAFLLCLDVLVVILICVSLFVGVFALCFALCVCL